MPRTISPHPKPKTYRSKKYLAFTRSRPCAICGMPDSDPHHVKDKNSGMGIKGSDLSAVPLCRVHHSQIDSVGNKTFQEIHNKTFIYMRFCNLAYYLCELIKNDNVYEVLVPIVEQEIERLQG